MPKSGKKGTQEWCIATNLIVKSKFGSACVSFSPLAPYSAPSIILPLVVVIGATMAKEGVEDWRRNLQDIEANNRKVEVYDKSSCSFRQTKWKDLRVGDLVKCREPQGI